jgi:hypothetical protein
MQRGGHRVLIYSQMVKLLKILKVYCEIKGYHHMVLSGSTCFTGTKVQVLQPDGDAASYF